MPVQKKIYVIGHKNPDTDSVVSAIAYANLKRLMGYEGCFPARAGKLNPQTEYILDRFGVPEPEFIGDLTPKVRTYMSEEPLTLRMELSLWKALEVLSSSGYKMLPVVDEEGLYTSALHYNVFGQNILKKVNPDKSPVISTNLRLLAETLNGELINGAEPEKLFDAQVIVAASDIESLRSVLDGALKENCIVMVGNRKEVQDYVISTACRCLIVTGRHEVDLEQRKAAAETGTGIILSPYDTVTTSALALYSTPVMFMGDKGVVPLKANQTIKEVSELINKSVSRALPVVDDGGRVIGILSQGDLMREPNLDIIMVDHNESSQALDGIENYRILEIIDHHRLGNLHTAYPITFINKPVGSTATIVASMYRERNLSMSKETASILLSGILSDTLALRSATATEDDRKNAEELAALAGLDIVSFGADIMTAASAVAKKPAGEIIGMDLKKYFFGDKAYTISQTEVTSLEELEKRREEICAELASLREKENLLFASLMVTDITCLDSTLFIKGAPSLIKEIDYPRIGDGIFLLKGAVSRKKQLLPYLSELLKRIS